jgi:hypothetical protein
LTILAANNFADVVSPDVDNADGRTIGIYAIVSPRSGEVDPGPIASFAAAMSALKVEDVALNGYSVDRATVRQRKTDGPSSSS